MIAMRQSWALLVAAAAGWPAPAHADFLDDVRRTFQKDIPRVFEQDIPRAFRARTGKHSSPPDQPKPAARPDAPRNARPAPR